MAGFIVNLAKGLERLDLYIKSGVYGTRISPAPQRRRANLMTLADYVLMRPGDLIFFFQERRIYGIGEIIDFGFEGKPCILCNFPRSYILDEPSKQPYLWFGDKDPLIRWRVFFQPHPSFFQDGVDMDEVLQSDTIGVARALPLFWNRSFLNLESDEANLIAHTILRRNLGKMNAPLFADDSQITHKSVLSRTSTVDFTVDLDTLVNHHASGGMVFPEAALQVWLVGNLAMKAPGVTAVFGEWDYICNLYPASPVKPRDYMDEMDIFGYSLAPALNSIPPYVQTFKIIEVKSESQAYAPANVVDQTMKYVDWISVTRAGGDYGLVEAYIVARDFDDRLIDYAGNQAVRPYVIPRRPYETKQWRNLKLVKYEHTGASPALCLTSIKL